LQEALLFSDLGVLEYELFRAVRNMKDLVIFGMGQIADVIHYYFTEEAGRRVVAFTVDSAYRTTKEHLGLPVVPFEELTASCPPDTHELFVAMSFRQVNKAREAKVREAETKGYTLASHVSPRATVWSQFKAKPNTIVMEHNVIQPFVTVGRNVIMWSGNHVGHHTSIADHCFIASHAVISGSVTIGEGTFVGVNATIRDNVKIGARNVLGAATLILADTPDNAVFMGQATEMSRVPSNRLRSI
jgi:sugar O-acyltransferase (sialic acid O-acetyltransferase NeuD family)